ncbi:MAG: hypothetical protein ACOY3Y_16780 [Acidobacteriota bacterium]
MRARLAVLPILLLSACDPAELDGSEQEGASDAGERELFYGANECDQSKYNCKLPAAPKDRNRIFNDATGSYDWPIAAGAHLRDGLGNVRGVVVDAAVKINYGLRKPLVGVNHVYAFAARLDTGLTASGWVRETALAHGPITRMPTVAHSSPGQGDYEADWTVTGGKPSAFGDLKVAPNFTGSNVAATDYLLRPGNVVNLLYNLPGRGGVAVDTFPAGVGFKRARGVEQLEIKCYKPGGSTVQRLLPFIFGHIGGRYGWIARDALALANPSAPAPAPTPPAPPSPAPAPTPPAPTPPAPTANCWVRCCDSLLTGIVAASGSACHSASQGICQGHGYVKHSTFGGADLYSRPTQCYAKCAIHTAYHALDGVTVNCTAEATAWCKGRGGLTDAKWAQCP